MKKRIDTVRRILAAALISVLVSPAIAHAQNLTPDCRHLGDVEKLCKTKCRGKNQTKPVGCTVKVEEWLCIPICEHVPQKASTPNAAKVNTATPTTTHIPTPPATAKPKP